MAGESKNYEKKYDLPPKGFHGAGDLVILPCPCADQWSKPCEGSGGLDHGEECRRAPGRAARAVRLRDHAKPIPMGGAGDNLGARTPGR
jgi:hypothetical protein